MKVKSTIKKVGAVAGSALMVGMTMGAAQSLADFPQPFVDSDGMVQSQIVVGSQGNQADVVGAINVAAALGQSAVQTETRDVPSGGGAFGWSASSGATLDTRNDNLFFTNTLDQVRDTLTSDHLSVLEDVTFTDDAGDDYDIEYYLYPDNQEIQFGNDAEGLNNEDPVLYVDNPSSATDTDHLFQLQANFQDEINFSNTDVQGEDIELFGTEYTVSEDTVGDELILFGSTQTLSLSTTGTTSGTVTINGNDHTIEIDGVNDGGVIYRYDGGEWEQKLEGETFTIDGETVRIDNVIDRVDDAGSASFEVGSEELHLMDDEAIEDGDGDDVDGTWVQFDGGGQSGNYLHSISTIDVFVGSDNDDVEYVGAGESYTHSLFGNVEFHFGGLNPDAGEGSSASVGEVRYSTTGDDTATVRLTDDSGDEANVEFAHTPDSGANVNLADDDGDAIHVVEGAQAVEDEFIFTDAGDFSHMWEVTSIDPDAQTASATDEATVTVRDVFSGNNVDVDLDQATSTTYQGTKVIDGQTYRVEVDTQTAGSLTDDTVSFYWGDGSSGFTTGDETTLFPPVDGESGAAMGLIDGTETVSHVNNTEQTYVLPSTESSATQSVTLNASTEGSTQNFLVSSSTGVSATDETQAAGDAEVVNATVQNGLNYEFTEDAANDQITVQLYVDGTPVAGPASFVIEPEDDDGDEQAYVQEPSGNTADDRVDLNGPAYSGGSNLWSGLVQLESDSDVQESYDIFGAHTVYDSDEQGVVTLHIPDGQAAAGAAFTAPGGSLTAGGGDTGGTSGDTYEAVVDQGTIPNMARMDTEVTSSVRSNNHLILVGGPAVNQLVADLASDGETWTQQQWLDEHDNEALLQVVQDAFTQDRHALIVAGHSAEDTRAAARYISNYADHEQALEDAGNQLTLTEADYPSSN